jgi:two-component SAPR family response regulator
VDVDWWRVLDSYARVAAASDDAARLAHLQAAIDDISGGLADGAEYEWIDTDREYTRRHLVQIYAQAASLIAGTDPQRCLQLCDAACGLDPLSDELARRAMRAAAALGDADTIRHRLTVLRQQLEASGIDIDPDTESFAADLIRDLSR